MKNRTEYTTTTRTFENAVVKIHRPVLDEKERQRRLERIRNAAADLLKQIN